MLRKIVILLTLAALTATLAAAPASAGLLPTYGIKAGANFANIDLDELDSSSKTGFVGGGFINLAWPIFNLQGELLYSTKGFNDATIEGAKTSLSVHTIQIPALLKFKLPIPAVAPSAYIGPALSFTTKAEATDADGETFDVKDDLESSIWSLILGIDVTLMDRFIIDARYDMGLSSLSKDSSEIGDVKGRTITVMVGIQF